MSLFRLLTLSLAFGICALCHAATTMTHQQAHDIFATGNAAYRTQDYDKAAEAYVQLINAGYETAPVLYNMGTSAARLGNKGEAIAYLLKARQLDPRNENIRANLAKVDPPPMPEQPNITGASAESVWTRVIHYFTTTEWLAMLWGGLLVASISGSILLLRPHNKAVLIAKTTLPLSVAAILLVSIPAVSHIYKARVHPQAVAIKPAEVLSGPAERFTRVASVQEGQVLTSLRHETDGYSRVKLPNGQQGYIKQEQLMNL